MGRQVLTLVRGIPGSGKSYVAEGIAVLSNAVHVEADMYRIEKYGEYKFYPEDTAPAHAWCKQSAEEALEVGVSVVVANTFVKRWEMQPYIEMAKVRNIPIQIVTVQGDLGDIHNVPKETKERMHRNFEF